MLPTASLAFAEVGLVVRPLGAWIFRPRNRPVVTLINAKYESFSIQFTQALYYQETDKNPFELGSVKEYTGQGRIQIEMSRRHLSDQ